MTPDQMRASSQKKFKQVDDLMSLLKVSFTAKDKLMPDGFIERVIVFTDNEEYPTAIPPSAMVPLEQKDPVKEEEVTTGEKDAGQDS